MYCKNIFSEIRFIRISTDCFIYGLFGIVFRTGHQTSVHIILILCKANLPTAVIRGAAAQGYSSGQAMEIMEQIVRDHLPDNTNDGSMQHSPVP